LEERRKGERRGEKGEERRGKKRRRGERRGEKGEE
jgi:hypothetical protein